jgi:hypothetical protein
MATPRDQFRGALLGALIGDVAGAVVEAESPQYIARTYRSIDDLLAADNIPELTGPAWQVGRYTDDTQMLLCVAEWLIADEFSNPTLSPTSSTTPSASAATPTPLPPWAPPSPAPTSATPRSPPPVRAVILREFQRPKDLASNDINRRPPPDPSL